MHSFRPKRIAILIAALSLVITTGGLAASASASAPRSVRGFDGSTVKVAGLAYMSNFGGDDVGAIARFNRANDTHEVKGITFDYTGNNDDGADPATALGVVRRLVTQDQVFAVVPDLSPYNPGDYMTQEHLLHLGWPLDVTYCSSKPTTTLWGFGFPGCQVNPSPSFLTDTYGQYYKYVNGKTGKKHPTMAAISQDNSSGQSVIKTSPIAEKGAGFKVVYSKATLPETVGDYSPYVQGIMTADNGNQPDVFNCLVTTQCIPIVQALRAAGFKGYILTPIFADVLLKPLMDTDTRAQYNTEPSPALTQMTNDIAKAKPGTKVSQSNAMAYFAADMFVKAVKQVGKSKLTPEAVQKVLSKQTWEITGLGGPTTYPTATVAPFPNCNSILSDADGTAWTISTPYACSSKKFKVKG
jgi:ABC-type branched-subunit amino acid transport system substrate-binding protein